MLCLLELRRLFSPKTKERQRREQKEELVRTSIEKLWALWDLTQVLFSVSSLWYMTELKAGIN